MAMLNVNVHLGRACRLLNHLCRRFSSGRDCDEGAHIDVSHSISRQILQAGFNVLKQGNIDSLKQNAVNRAAPIDFDKLVCTHLIRVTDRFACYTHCI